MSAGIEDPTRKQEWRVFVFLALFMAPILSIMLVGSYGFIVWMSHILLGPPSY